MKIGGIIEGIALDTLRNESREECMKINVNGVDTFVELDTVSKLEVSIENPYFTDIFFN